MTRQISLLFITLATFAFTSQASVPTAAYTFDTNIRLYGISASQATKIRLAEDKIKNIISSSAFQVAVLNHKYNGKNLYVDNNGLSNSQIYSKILIAAEIKYPSKNNRMDMGVKLYSDNSNTVGWTNRSITYINMNTKYFNKYNANQVARNMMHEWLHKLGFGHAVNYSKKRDYSVPYAIGSIVAKLAPRF
jgi:hypothetical protein